MTQMFLCPKITQIASSQEDSNYFVPGTHIFGVSGVRDTNFASQRLSARAHLNSSQRAPPRRRKTHPHPHPINWHQVAPPSPHCCDSRRHAPRHRAARRRARAGAATPKRAVAMLPTNSWPCGTELVAVCHTLISSFIPVFWRKLCFGPTKLLAIWPQCWRATWPRPRWDGWPRPR